MHCTRKLYSHEDGKSRELLVEYDQPVKDRLVYLVYNVYWHMWFKVPFLKPVARWINKTSIWWHNMRCDGKCGKRKDLNGDGKWEPACVYWGWDTHTDFRIYTLDNKNNYNVRYPL